MESNSSNTTFVHRCRDYSEFQYGYWVYSVAVFILYAVLQRRANRDKWSCCNGYFGIPLPVNFIHETKDRWIYALGFGALSSQFLTFLFDGNILESSGVASSVFKGVQLLVVMIVYTIGYFALFGSIHEGPQILAPVIGFAFIAAEFIQNVLMCHSCNEAAHDTTTGVDLRTELADLYFNCILNGVYLGLLGAFFAFKFIQSVTYALIGKPFPPQHTVAHHIGYVKRLLNRRPMDVSDNKYFASIKRNLYQWDPYFKYSVRILSAVLVIITAILILTFELINLLVSNLIVLREAFDSLGPSKDVTKFVNAFINVLYFLSVLIPLISCGITIVNLLLYLAAYRRHCKQIWAGDYSFLPAKKSPFANTLVLYTA